jgi:GNAT superfamily N-acetyltransferase
LRLREEDLGTLNSLLPVWNSIEYARRLQSQNRLQLVQAVAWDGDVPVGRGMALFPEHEEYSASALREGCVEVRDVFVSPSFRRRGAARAIMRALEDAARETGMPRIGLAVALDDDGAPARALYDALGYRTAHGPFLSGSVLRGDDGPIPVGAVLTYLVKDL